MFYQENFNSKKALKPKRKINKISIKMFFNLTKEHTTIKNLAKISS